MDGSDEEPLNIWLIVGPVIAITLFIIGAAYFCVTHYYEIECFPNNRSNDESRQREMVIGSPFTPLRTVFIEEV